MCDATHPEKNLAETLESIDMSKVFELPLDVKAMFIQAKAADDASKALGVPCICPHGVHPTMCNRPQGRCDG